MSTAAKNKAKTSAIVAGGKASKKGGKVVTVKRHRRRHYTQLPKPDARADLYWGVNQPELRDVTDAQLAKSILDSPEFDQVLGPKLDQIDHRNRNLRGTATWGRPARWSARHFEALLIYRRVSGLGTVKRARERLQSDPEALMLLGFGKSIPSAPVISRHLNENFDPEQRRDFYRELDRQLRKRVMALPGFDEEARKLGIDGSKEETRYTPPLPRLDDDDKPIDGEYWNADIPKGERNAITAPDAGIVGKNGGPKAGKGWQFVGLFSEHGTLLGWDISALHESEHVAARRVFKDYEREILPHRGTTTVSVCTADGGFNSTSLRARLQELRIAPNLHKASHAVPSRARAERLTNQWWPFKHPSKRHYGNWGANGHAELSCKCGKGTTERIFNASKTGHLTIATRGSCQSCGNVTITSGKWHHADNPDSYVLALGDKTADPAVGNSLTFNDPLAKEYGRDRFGWNESIHATLERRFGLLKQRGWMRSKVEVETEFAITASAISLLLIEREARRSAAAGRSATRSTVKEQAA